MHMLLKTINNSNIEEFEKAKGIHKRGPGGIRFTCKGDPWGIRFTCKGGCKAYTYTPTCAADICSAVSILESSASLVSSSAFSLPASS